MENFVEQLVAEYYRTKGYLVSSNYWIPFESKRYRKQNGKEQEYIAQSWTDIDVLARNDNELLIIQVKAIINQKSVSENIINYFTRVKAFLEKGVAIDGTSDISWWQKDVEVKNIVVYEYYSPPSYIELLTKRNIKTIKFSDIFKKLLDYASRKKGVKEENASMRFLEFLINEKLLKTEGYNER
jgi:hypothetical protein